MTEPTQSKNKWIADDKTRAAFWADAARLGFDHETVHTILGVMTMKDFAGTRAEAAGQLAKARKQIDAEAKLAATQAAQPPADEIPGPDELPAIPTPEPPADEPAPAQAAPQDTAAAYAVAVKGMAESPCLAFTRIATPAGFTWSVTIRAGMPEAVENEAMRSIFRQIQHFEKGAAAAGWLAVADGRDTIQVGMKPRSEAPQAQPPQAGAQLPPQAGGGAPPQGTGEALTFKAEKLVATITDGKTYWKVKGGKFAQYGVSIWPEVIAAAGWDADALKPTETYNLTGYVAHYALNDKGKPGKVTELVKAA